MLQEKIEKIRPKENDNVLRASCDLHFDGWSEKPENKKHYECPIKKMVLTEISNYKYIPKEQWKEIVELVKNRPKASCFCLKKAENIV